MAEEVKYAGVSIITGDTKVVPKGKCDKIFITTSGVGFIKPKYLEISEAKKVKPGYKLIINGTLGDHAIAILSSRESLTFETPVKSDCAALNHMIKKVLDVCPGVAFMRDATRGGLATVVCELATKTSYNISLFENQVPVNDSVMAICELFGFDPLFQANEGKVLMVVPGDIADKVIATLKSNELGSKAAIIGEVTGERNGKVVLETITGGKRLIDMPSGAQLPRIC
jgi:hydrogenase expression/formation protein HypE